jgi:hypothetical protein
VGEYLLDDYRIFNAGGDVHGRTNAAGARMRNSGHFDATAAGTARFSFVSDNFSAFRCIEFIIGEQKYFPSRLPQVGLEFVGLKLDPFYYFR